MDAQQKTALLATLQARFEANMRRHPGLAWDEVAQRLGTRPGSLAALQQMEDTGGEPDVIGVDDVNGGFLFADCSPESPAGRRNCCYDRAGLESRKEHRPETSAVELATSMGIELLDEQQYRRLQELGEFDLKTSSWILTPPEIRKLGGALFCDRRYGQVFVYHNGAQSYYGVRGFRGLLRV